MLGLSLSLAWWPAPPESSGCRSWHPQERRLGSCTRGSRVVLSPSLPLDLPAAAASEAESGPTRTVSTVVAVIPLGRAGVVGDVCARVTSRVVFVSVRACRGIHHARAKHRPSCESKWCACACACVCVCVCACVHMCVYQTCFLLLAMCEASEKSVHCESQYSATRTHLVRRGTGGRCRWPPMRRPPGWPVPRCGLGSTSAAAYHDCRGAAFWLHCCAMGRACF